MTQPYRYLLLCPLIGLLGCATPEDGEATDYTTDPRRGEATDTVCFTGGLSGFTELSDNALVLRRSASEAYLVTTGHCPNLDVADGLKIDDPAQCLSRGSRLLVFDTPFPRVDSIGDRPDRCLVTGIYKWDDRDRGAGAGSVARSTAE